VEKGELTEFAAAGGSAGGTGALSPAQKKEIETLGADIRHIKQGEQSVSLLYRKAWYWALVALPWLLLLAVWLLRKARKKERKPNALKILEKRLKNAQQKNAKKKNTLIANEVALALEDALDARGLTREQLGAALESKGTPQETIQKIGALLDACDYARFAGGSTETAKLVEEAREILKDL
jgi:hypothetical protein